jgi:hypothetical protein
MSKLDININGVVFQEINQPWFVVYGEEDKFPFLNSGLIDCGDHSPNSKVGNFPRREYRAVVINGKFYAPVIQTHGGN